MSTNTPNLEEATQIIKAVLVNKFEKDSDNFNRTMHELLFGAKEWCGETLLFNLPYHVRRNDHTTWSTNRNHDWDTCVHCNWDLNPEIVRALLAIQPIDFWTLHLRISAYKASILHLSSLKNFSDFLNDFSKDVFPYNAWNEFQAYALKVFKEMDEEDVIAKLKRHKLPLLFIEKLDPGKVQINMMHILLYTMLFQLDHEKVSRLCIFIAYMMMYIESGLDADKSSSNVQTMKNWNDNGNWGKIVNYYLIAAQEDLFNKLDIIDCWNSLVQEDGIRIYPFEFKAERFEEFIGVKNERMRAWVNEHRKK